MTKLTVTHTSLFTIACQGISHKHIYRCFSVWAFNDYVKKVMSINGPKMTISTIFSVEIVHVEVGRWSKRAKIVSTQTFKNS